MYLIPVLVLVLLMPFAAVAQSGPYNAHGYGFFGVDTPNGGSIGDFLVAGGGGEGFLWKGLAAGGDVSYFWPRRYSDEGIGIFSVGPAWYFTNRSRNQRLTPFVNAGYSLGFRSGTGNFIHWGGGTNWWFASRVGLRVEVRTLHYVGEYSDRFTTSLRFGVTFR